MALFEESQKEASKAPRYIFLAIIIVLIIAFFVWRGVRYNSEKATVAKFFSAVSAGDLQQAYKLWQPAASYSFKDFQDDWGPKGFYGPVKSFQVESGSAPQNSNTSVAVEVLLSPYQPFPKSGTVEAQKTRQMTIWVNRQTQALSFPPPAASRLFPAAPLPVRLGSTSLSPA